MSFNWGDSFDLYTAIADMVTGYWDSAANGSFVAGRFTGRALALTANSCLYVKTSSVNDAVHHVVVSYKQTAAISGVTLGNYITFYDGANAQCSIVFRADGAILLTSGGPGGTVLDTWTGVITAANLWGGYEFEVVINNTTGSWAVRINGNIVNDHALGSLNTRPVSTNNYANKIQIGQSATVNSQVFDDLYWQSGSATGNWLGDLRCYTRMPATDNTIQFSRSTYAPQLAVPNGTLVVTGGRGIYMNFIPKVNGSIGSAILPMTLGYSGNLKSTIFSDNAGAPGTALGSANVLANPATGNNTITFGTPVTIVRGVQYWFGIDSDTTSGTYTSDNVGNDAFFSNTAYASFPVNNPASGGVTSKVAITINVTATDNNSFTSEVQQDGAITYVYDSTVNDADFYGTAAVSGVITVACITRAYMTKNDAGLRTGAVQLKSGGTTVASPTLTLSNAGFLWAYRVDLTDPATSAAWTVAGVNAALIGPIVIA